MSQSIARLYWDPQVPGNHGWAYSFYDGADFRKSGPVEGTLSQTATFADVLAHAPSFFPMGNAEWRSLEHNGPGWEVRGQKSDDLSEGDALYYDEESDGDPPYEEPNLLEDEFDADGNPAIAPE